MATEYFKPGAGKIALSIFLVASTSLLLQGAGKSAADYFKEGSESYSKGDYKNAARLFEHITTHVPTHTSALYFLGSSYVKLGRNADAKSAYERCMATTGADETTKTHCQTAIDQLNKAIESAAATPAAGATNTSKKSSREEENMRRYLEQVAEIDKRRDAILSEAKKQAQKLRQESEDRLKYEEANSNQRLRNYETGERKLGLTSTQKEAITGDARREADRIMDIANQRVKGMQYPPKPN